ncbi:hypothetical protein M427DRAFT_136438 [Gonapodya prolifera JEL478]|uniref:Uncharacterized protein n=1 Tax=Gonapodya prolifera (strain JEL478) TaxID=1344416 RepID=A0A139AAB2_GONPJ|nr:hypothetical protein M427DRAFT_136438 [Gonapodya prolifera JEL478]|eukprot:KXS13667.1 hypothetical protein M427DRAFT_136438 [Gonapodya prolifera JEL478]
MEGKTSRRRSGPTVIGPLKPENGSSPSLLATNSNESTVEPRREAKSEASKENVFIVQDDDDEQSPIADIPDITPVENIDPRAALTARKKSLESKKTKVTEQSIVTGPSAPPGLDFTDLRQLALSPEVQTRDDEEVWEWKTLWEDCERIVYSRGNV